MFSVLSFFLLAYLQLVAKISANDKIDPGKPLFLTPYLEKGSIDQARRLSIVGPLPGLSPSQQPTTYSGYFTINKSYGSNMFFWFTPARLRQRDAPMILWLQGGPGSSSLFGLFLENGPFMLDENSKVTLRKATLQKYFNMIYVDEPIGAGYSFTMDDKGYARTSEDAADDLYIFLQQFFQMFPEYRHNDFYVAGESYGAKFATCFAYKLHIERSKSGSVNLKGIMLGVGFFDPLAVLNSSAYLYETGLIDINGYILLQSKFEEVYRDFNEGKVILAYLKLSRLLSTEAIPTMFQELTGYNYDGNILHTTEPVKIQKFRKFILESEFRKAIHVGNVKFGSFSVVVGHLYSDYLLSKRDKLEELLNHYKSLVYVGHLDPLVPVGNMEALMESLSWKYKSDYQKVNRIIWKRKPSDKEIVGYVKDSKTLTFVTLRNCGHYPGYDNTVGVTNMYLNFVYNFPFGRSFSRKYTKHIIKRKYLDRV